MFAIEYVHKSQLHPEVAPDDLRWTRMHHRYHENRQALDDMGWLAFEDDQYSYRVVEVEK